jgi:hypothetical protein
LRREFTAGELVTLDAGESSDPDSCTLSFRWRIYRKPGDYAGDVALEETDGQRLQVRTPPSVDAPRTVHLILEVTDSGDPALTSYRRVIPQIIEPQGAP